MKEGRVCLLLVKVKTKSILKTLKHLEVKLRNEATTCIVKQGHKQHWDEDLSGKKKILNQACPLCQLQALNL